jgi:hypothetical protein
MFCCTDNRYNDFLCGYDCSRLVGTLSDEPPCRAVGVWTELVLWVHSVFLSVNDPDDTLRYTQNPSYASFANSTIKCRATDFYNDRKFWGVKNSQFQN